MKGKAWNFHVKWVKGLGTALLLYASIVPSVTGHSILWSYSIGGISDLSVSESGNFIVVGCHDGFYYLFDTWGNLLGSKSIPDAVVSLDIADTGDLIIGSTAGYTFYTSEGTQVSSFLSSPVKNISVSSEGRFSLVCCKGNLFINERNSMIYQLEVSSDFPIGAMSSNGSLACAASDRSLHMFRDGKFQEPYELDEEVKHLFVSSNGKKIIFSTENGKIGYMDMDGELQLKDVGSPIVSMATSPDGNIVLVSTIDKLIWLKGKSIFNELPIEHEVRCFSISEDGSFAVIGKGDGTIQLITIDGTYFFTHDFGSHIVASEISENYLLVISTENSIYTFQLLQEANRNNQFNPISSRKSIPLTSSIHNLWSIPVAENADFFAADVDGDGFTEVILKEGTKLKLIDEDGNQESMRDLEIPFTSVSQVDFNGITIPEIYVIFEYSIYAFSIYDWREKSIREYYLDSLRENLSQIGDAEPFAVLDNDNDGRTEILVSVSAGYSCKPRGVASVDYLSGDIVWFYQMGPSAHPDVVEDIDSDGTMDIILGSVAPCNCEDDEKFPDCEIYVIALSSTGEELWKTHLGEGFLRVEICAEDVDDHEGIEIIGFGYEASENWGKLFVLNCFGEYLHDFEVDYSIFPGAVGDIDGDGNKEIITVDSRGYLSIFAHDLQKKSEKFIEESISSRSQLHLNDINGDGDCEIILGFENELHIFNKDLEDMWEKEFEDDIKTVLTYFSGCKNTLLVLSDKLYAFSYEDAKGPCPLWEITERELSREGTAQIDTAESTFAAGDYGASKMYFEKALITYSQLEDRERIDYISKRITEISTIIFKYNVEMGTVVVAVIDVVLCVAILYYWITRKRWYREAEGTLLLSLPVFLGLFQVYYAVSSQVYYAVSQSIQVFAMYFIPSFVFSVAVFLRQKILGFAGTILVLRKGHKDMLVLSIGRSDGSYRVSVESIEEKFRPVKESREITFSREARNDIIKRVEYMMEFLKKVPSETHAFDYAEELLRKTGAEIYQNIIPEDFSDILKARFLLLEVEDTEIPWELMYADSFFSLKYGISRRIVSTESVNIHHKEKRGRRALIISDPRENLPDARTECKIVYKRLKQKMDTVLMEGCDANIGKIAHQFGQGSDIIHYAGHVKDGLLLSDGVMSSEEVKEFIVGTPIVFVNGCKSEELARAFLLGGAMAYVGTIHPVHDNSAAEIAADFYELCLKYQIGEALRRTRKNHVAKNLVWASLVMYGDPTLKLL